jgi:hypothetical protein
MQTILNTASGQELNPVRPSFCCSSKILYDAIREELFGRE